MSSYAPHQNCWYAATVEGLENVSPVPMNHSFWTAYMASFLEQVLSFSYNDVKVQQVEDSYDEDVTFKLQREKVVSVARIVPHIKGVRENQLLIDWQIFQH